MTNNQEIISEPPMPDSAVVAAFGAVGTGVITGFGEMGLAARTIVDAINGQAVKDDLVEMLKLGGVGVVGMVCLGALAAFLDRRANRS